MSGVDIVFLILLCFVIWMDYSYNKWDKEQEDEHKEKAEKEKRLRKMRLGIKI